MPGQPSMLFSFVNGVWVGVHTADNPSTAEWNDYCARFERTRTDIKGVLVFSLGGGPGFRQREQLRLAMGDATVPLTAIMSSSPLARGIITSINWFTSNHELMAFAPHDIEGALRYLSSRGLTMPRAQILATLTQHAAQLRVVLPFRARQSLVSGAR